MRSAISKARKALGYFYVVPWCVSSWGWREFSVTVRCILLGQVKEGFYKERLLNAMKGFLGVKYAIPVNRGRTAIELALRAMNIGKHDEVILPAYICQSVLDAIRKVGAQPAFADIDSSLHLTVDTVWAAMSPRTKAVIVPHLFGNTAEIDKIEWLLKGTGISLIDDAAQSFGATRTNRFVGTFGDCGIVSCGPGKALAGSAGGLLVTNKLDIYRRAKSIQLKTQSAKSVIAGVLSFWIWRRFRKYSLPMNILIQRMKHEYPEAVYETCGISNLDAGICLMQLRTLQKNAAIRRKNAKMILGKLSEMRKYSISDLSTESTLTKLVVVLPGNKWSVDNVKECFGEVGIECQGGYMPLHKGHNEKMIYLPVTERLWENVLCVPIDTKVKKGKTT